MKRSIAFGTLAVLLVASFVQAADICAVCGGPFERVAYFFQDKVDGERKQLCEKCAHATKICYLCGLPAMSDYQELSDGRILCSRDLKNVVLDEDEAQRIWEGVKDAVERQFSRFITFPQTVTVEPLDRVELQALFKTPGNDYICPNVWGCTRRQTNNGQVSYKISLLRGLPTPVLKATCAHELTHTWLSENVPTRRKRSLDQDAVEGFCELVAYHYMATENDAAQLDVIKSNAYTRGQFSVFLEAEKRFGFNDLADWMKYGLDARLSEADLGRVRMVEMPRPVGAASKTMTTDLNASPATTNAPAPETLALKGIMWSKTRPMALINNYTFTANEQGKVRLGQSNVLVRCVAIREDSVVVQVVGSSEQQTLTLE